MFFNQQPVHLARADELRQEPPKGSPYSVALPGTEKPGRSKIYRAYRAQNELVKTLDPHVCVYLRAWRRYNIDHSLLGSHRA
jgi:long-chain acyl-CoA synthetase